MNITDTSKSGYCLYIHAVHSEVFTIAVQDVYFLGYACPAVDESENQSGNHHQSSQASN